jgi:hypothetical protein
MDVHDVLDVVVETVLVGLKVSFFGLTGLRIKKIVYTGDSLFYFWRETIDHANGDHILIIRWLSDIELFDGRIGNFIDHGDIIAVHGHGEMIFIDLCGL